MEFRSSASFGKRMEFVAVGDLLRRGYDVYMTLVDDQQIDCIIRQEVNGHPHYMDVQIKARSINAKNAAVFSALVVRNPRRNYFFVFYSEVANTFWVMPSLDFIKHANQNKEGIHAGKYRIVLANQTNQGLTPRPKFRAYEGNFDLIQQYFDTIDSQSP